MIQKVIVFDGITFVRDEKTNYYLCSLTMRGKRLRLHTCIWEKHYGLVPKGYVVHHKDLDKTNNDINNLELLTRSEHVRLHWCIRKINELIQVAINI